MNSALKEFEIDDLVKEQFVVKEGVLHRFSRPFTTSVAEIVDQIVVPETLRGKVMSLAHEDVMSGHLGVHKSYCKLKDSFYWVSMKKDIKQFVSSCHECQMAGKPNKKIPKAPMINFPVVGEPFEEVVIDLVGPLPKSKKGNQYILSIMDRMSRYPEAIPIRNGKAKTVIFHLIHYFTRFGLPKNVQSVNGSNFMKKGQRSSNAQGCT